MPDSTQPGSDGDKASLIEGRYAHAESAVLILILAVALGLRLWGLDQNGWGAEYYTAAVRSMLHGWHNFFFAAFDPSGFISVDKPPVALWVQVLSARVFGFYPVSVLVPQAVMGVLSIWLTFVMVRNSAGAAPALLAATLMTFSPLLVAVNRANNMDSCLLLFLLMAGAAFLRAAEDGDRKFLCAAAVALGIAFNVKMLAAFVILPAFVVVYGLMTPIPWRRRCIDIGIAALVTLVVAFSWAVSVDLTAPEDRPYIGGTTRNSMFELILGHNAANRFFSPRKEPAPSLTKPVQGDSGRATDPVSSEVAEISTRSKSAMSSGDEVRKMIRTVLKREFVRTPSGPFRLVDGLIAAQFAWFLPFALAGAFLGFRRKGVTEDIPAVGDATFRRALWFFVLWAATCWALYSSLGGIIHYYYLAPIIPPLSALSGVGIALLWRHSKQNIRGLLSLGTMLLITVVWQVHVHVDALVGANLTVLSSTIGWQNGPLLVMVVGGLIAIVGLLTIGWRRISADNTGWLAGIVAVGLASLFAIPICWALSSILVPGPGLLPSADLYRLVAAQNQYFANATMRQWKRADTRALAKFLIANRGESRYLLATTTTMIAAPLIIETDEAVLVRGGFHGLDQALSPDRMAALVNRRDLRFVMVGDVSSAARRMGGDVADRPISDWVRLHGKRIDPGLWRVSPDRGNIELFDLRPDPGLATPSVSHQDR